MPIQTIKNAAVDVLKTVDNTAFGGAFSQLGHGGTNIGMNGPITFPSDLKDGHEAIRFEFFKEYQFDRNENKGEAGASLVIYLPIPQNLQAAYAVQYEQAEIGFIGRAAARGLDDNVMEDLTGGALNLLAQATESGAAAIAGTGAASKILGKKFEAVAGVVSTGLTQAAKGAMIGSGQARNPHMAQVFKNVNFRSHQLAFKLAPKSIQEQNSMRDIIKAFKIAMHPKYKIAGHFFDYPGQFDIDLVTGTSDEYFFNIGPSVLTSMSVDYLPNGPQVHDVNGAKAPIAVNLSLQFTELKIVTQDEISESNY